MVVALTPDKWTPGMEWDLDLLIAGGMTDVGDLRETFRLTAEEILAKLEQRYPVAMVQRRAKKERRRKAC